MDEFTQVNALTAMRMAINAMQEAMNSHGRLLMTDPPQDPWKTRHVDDMLRSAIAALDDAIAQAKQAQPTAWQPISEPYERTDALDIMLSDGSILCGVIPQFDGDLWWSGDGTGEKFIDPKVANVTHWRIHGSTEFQRPAPTDDELRARLPEASIIGADCGYNDYYAEDQMLAFARAVLEESRK